MKKACLFDKGRVCNYTVVQFKPQTPNCNEVKIENIVNRQFDKQLPLNVVVSDLPYVRVGHHWHYLCVIVNLFNREIIGYSSAPNKDVELVKKAFINVKINFSQMKFFMLIEETNSKIKSLMRFLIPLTLTIL